MLLHAVHPELCHARDGGYPNLWLVEAERWVNSRVPHTVAIRIADAPKAERALAIRKSTFREYVWVEMS